MLRARWPVTEEEGQVPLVFPAEHAESCDMGDDCTCTESA